MLKNYLKITLRNLLTNKTYSLINILGFAFSISICLMIVLYLIKEYSFDNYHTNTDYIYRLTDAKNEYSSIDYRVKDVIKSNFGEVKNACLVQILSGPMEINIKNKAYYINNLMSTDNNFFKMFSVPFVYGNSSKPFQNINSVILTESAAKTLFQNEHPLGKEVILWHRYHVIVSGVIKDFPDNSSLNANILVNAENKDFRFYFSCEDYSDISSHRYLFNIYLQLNENTNPVSLISNINNKAELLAPYEKGINLLPLKKMYLEDKTQGGETLKGNASLLNLFAIIALIILILAVINHVNLTVSRQSKRNKETGIRKTVGADRKAMVLLFLTESILVTSIAFAAAVIILEFALPFFNDIIDSSLTINPLVHFPANFILPFSILLIGVLSGAGPAYVLSAFNPIRMLNGNIITSKKKSFLRNVMIVFQFTISIGLIFCIIVIQKQISFVKNQNPGFNKEQLLRIDFPNIQESDKSKAFVLIDKLKQLPGIKYLSSSIGVPGSITNHMGSAIKGKDKSLAIIYADSSFLKTFKIEQTKGRNLLPGDMGKVCMLNETAYKYFEWTDLENRRYNNGKEGGFEVIGVVKDFHFASMHEPIEPLCILFMDDVKPRYLSLRIAGGAVGQTMEYIQKSWEEIIPDYPLNYQFFDEWFDSMYRKEDKLAKTIGLFALLAISISCLGILGLAIFSSESRSKEIGIRKIHGAEIKDLMLMLNIDYIKWLIVSFILACPIAWYIMNDWLEDFAYRTEISWWIFVLSAVAASGIALLTVSWQTWRASTANPVEALKYE